LSGSSSRFSWTCAAALGPPPSASPRVMAKASAIPRSISSPPAGRPGERLRHRTGFSPPAGSKRRQHLGIRREKAYKAADALHRLRAHMVLDAFDILLYDGFIVDSDHPQE